MKTLLLFVVLLVSGCLAPVEESENEDMTRGFAAPENWGQEKDFAIGQVPALPASAVVLSLPQMKEWRVPRVQTLIAAVDNADADTAQQYFLRWKLASGTGGARTSVLFDATGFTRVSLPVEQVTLSLAYEPYAGGTDSPSGRIKAHAYIGDFGVGEQDPGPTYTTYFSRAVGSPPQFITLPPGARRFRMIGDTGSIKNPFNSNVEVEALQGGSVVCRWLGGPTAPGDPSLFELFYSGGFIAIPGGVSRLGVFNGTGNPIEGFLQFALDL